MPAGRPSKYIDKAELSKLIEQGATCLDCANHFDVTESTIVNFLKKNYKMNFYEFSNKKKGSMRVALRHKQLELALAGNVPMLIWLGKQHLGQSDSSQIQVSENRSKGFQFIKKENA